VDDTLEVENCPRCGKVVLIGTVDLVPIAVDFEPVSFPEAWTLHSYNVPMVQVLPRKRGEETVVYARQFWASDRVDEWQTLVAHGCNWNPWKGAK
jgi:hypothetical protein